MGGTVSTVGGLNILLSGDAKGLADALDQAMRRIDQLEQRTRRFSRGASGDFDKVGQGVQRFGHATVSSTQAASGALRELEGNFTNNIRAVERFITLIPGVGNALKIAFPVVGGIAFLGVLYEMEEKVRSFIKATDEIPKHIREGFGEIHQAAILSNDALAVTNDRLAAEIAKLERKPVNALQTELDEARQSADQLTDSLGKAAAKEKELLDKNEVGFWGKALGQSGTDDAAAFVAKTRAAIQAINDDFAPALSAAGTPANLQALTDSKLASLQKVYAGAHAEAAKRIGAAKNSQYLHDTGQFGTGADQRANLAILGGFDTELSDEEKEIGGKYRQNSQQGRLTGDQAAKASTDAGRKADEERLKQMEGGLAQQNLLRNRTVKADYDYWQERVSVFAAGSQQYLDIERKMEALAAESATKAHETITRYNAEQKQFGIERAGLSADPTRRARLDQGRALADRYDASNELNALVAANAARLAEVKIQEDAGQTMTHIAAATELAAVHTREYGAALERLLARQKEIQGAHYLDGDEDGRQKQLGELSRQIESTQAGRRVQVLQDAYNTGGGGSSALVGATDALDEFVKAAKDASGAMQNFLGGAIGRTNDSIIRAITSGHGTRTDFGAAGADIFRSASGSLLKGAEGKLLQGFGFGGGKAPKGTLGDPLWVKMSSGVSGALGGAASGAGGFLGKAAGFLSGLLPGFADGGNPAPNSIAMVGERGPELVRFGSGGASVIPTQQIGAAMGGGGGIHFHPGAIDARGSTDPAQVDARVQEGIRRAAPHIIAASVHAGQERSRRMPSVKR